jgi:hypothetical protein
MLAFELFYEPDLSRIFDTHSSNKGIRDVLVHINDFRKKGIPIKVRDTARMSATDLEHAYSRAIVPSANHKYRIRTIFGTIRRAACFFGRQVPALLVSDPTHENPGDIYPHEKGGRIITIYEFLKEIPATS